MRFLLLKLLNAVAVALFCGVATPATAWRGITPMHSTRADVERLIGPAWHFFLEGSVYHTDEAEVWIVYTGQGKPAELCARKVPLNTVLSILVEPKEAFSPTDLGVNSDHFTFLKLSYGNHDYRGYYDENSGFLVRSLDGRATGVLYLANGADRPQCAGYYRKAKHLGEFRYDNL
jgi:hypothetical protein